uniref:Olfactory receptor n=1 Tax=Sphenodon punctatus TaxID=8508 RepID=A0A8D0G3R5_SPHPU
MDRGNQTSISGFILLGLSIRPEHQEPLISLFLAMYLLTLLGNLLIVLLIRLDTHLLHAPMYFFLSNLALVDVGFASTTVPKMLYNMMSQTKTISFSGCFTQMYFFLTFGNTDSLLLAAMAYDRYVAICFPLRYPTLMSRKHCLLLAATSWILSAFHSLLYTLLMSRLSFCTSRDVPYLFCDVYPLLGLSCSDTKLIKTLVQTEGVVDILGPFMFIMISYARIFCTIMKVPSATGKSKAFSTCASHLSGVILFYGTISCLYFQPPSSYSAQNGSIASLFYAVVIPMLNPFIYSLRNNEMKAAMKRNLNRMRVWMDGQAREILP